MSVVAGCMRMDVSGSERADECGELGAVGPVVWVGACTRIDVSHQERTIRRASSNRMHKFD